MINDEQWQGRIFPENSWIREFVNRSFLDPRREDQKYFAILRWNGWDDILCFYYWRKASVDGFAFVTSSRCLETWKQETKTQRDTFSWHSLWATNIVWILTLWEFFFWFYWYMHTCPHLRLLTHTHTHTHTHTYTHKIPGDQSSDYRLYTQWSLRLVISFDSQFWISRYNYFICIGIEHTVTTSSML